jgi:hypothetical protein
MRIARNNRARATMFVDRAIRLQLAEDDGPLSEVEDCLLKALKLDSQNIDALQETAHFYDAVAPNMKKAKKYALACRKRAALLIHEMDTLIKGLD